MNNVLKYKDYAGSVIFDAEDRIFHGRMLGITDVVGFEGESVTELENSFQEAVEDYLETCREIDKEPEKPFSGKFVVRVPPELHAQLVTKAKHRDISLNAFIKDQLEQAV